ncbi:MAG TPA: hypothetical protein VFD03_06470 [Clostridia bacterium]|nr:hypothetical protein [Clostridia bacterium]
MKCKFKNMFLFVIIVVLVFSSVSVVFATEAEAKAPVNPVGVTDSNLISPYYVGISTVTPYFQILSGGMANPLIKGSTYPGMVDYVNVIVILKRGSGTSWTTIKTWNQNINIFLNAFTFNQAYAITGGYSYKYSATVKSYKSGTLVESVSINSSVLEY